MNLWAISELNELSFAPGDTVSECWVHMHIVAYLFRVTLKTLQNRKMADKLRHHPEDKDLVLYGDVQRETSSRE